jgi:hypothetical protein
MNKIATSPVHPSSFILAKISHPLSAVPRRLAPQAPPAGKRGRHRPADPRRQPQRWPPVSLLRSYPSVVGRCRCRASSSCSPPAPAWESHRTRHSGRWTNGRMNTPSRRRPRPPPSLHFGASPYRNPFRVGADETADSRQLIDRSGAERILFGSVLNERRSPNGDFRLIC